MFYKIKMQHDEDSLVSLSRMQYDLFCTSNRVVRSLLSLVFIILGIVYASNWWGILLVAYGCYLTTSTYSSSNHTAHKLADQIKASGCGFPCSEYLFEEDRLRIITLPEGEELDALPYAQILRLGEDTGNFYIFRDTYGGYMIPKETLGDEAEAFRQFLVSKTGQRFYSRQAPIIRLLSRLSRR